MCRHRSNVHRHPALLDLLDFPVLGRFLRWRHARTVLQTFLLAVAVLVVLDGFWGPAEPSRNAAGTLPWVQWRGLVVIALLVVGNVFCMACPFMLPRRIAKRLADPKRPVPGWLKGKWVAIGTLIAFFWAYEALDLWASPYWTAWVVIGYFVVAFAVDGLFRGAAFCKHVCPIGQFHFVHTPLSPFEVKVRDTDTCATCETKDCIRGHWPADQVREREGFPLQRGCELWLFQQRKVGNLDCTFCMECIHACPHDNVGILSRPPAAELVTDPMRSGVGRLGERTDLAVLAAIMVFASLVNALGMVRPFTVLQRDLELSSGLAPGLILAGLLVLTLVVLPAGALALAASAEVLVTSRARRSTSGPGAPAGSIADPDVQAGSAWRRYTWGLVPLGLSMWAAHHFFHFALGSSALVPLGRRFVDMASVVALPVPQLPATTPELPWIFPVQVVLLVVGLSYTVRLLGRIGRDVHGSADPDASIGAKPNSSAGPATLPWQILAFAIFVVSVWLLAQPMEMRGVLGG